MRIQFHVSAPFIGGAERQLEYLLKYLKRLEPALETQVSIETPALLEWARGITPRAVITQSRKELFNAMEKFQPQVFQFYTSALAYRTLGLFRYKPRVVEVIHNKNQFGGDATTYPKDRTDAVVAVSPDAATFITTHAKVPRVTIIPNGVDTDRFNIRKRRLAETPTLGFAGRLCVDKGIPTILEIAEKIPATIELVGQQFMNLSVVPKNVKVLPPTTTPEAYYKTWWGFLSASPHEAFGLAIAEAMACGCPPVMLNCGGITAYLSHTKDSLIAEDAEELALYAAGIALQDGPTLDPTPTGQRFSAANMAKSYLEVYRGEERVVATTRSIARGEPLPQVLRSDGVGVPSQKPDTARIFRPISTGIRVPGGALGITPAGWYGVVRALAGFCDWYAEPEKAIQAIDEHRPRVVVLGCYQKGWRRICLHAKRAGAKVVATWHASFILNEFDQINRVWMDELFEAYSTKTVDFLATPHEGLAATWSHFGYKTAYFPNLIEEAVPTVKPLKGFHVGVLGSGQPWKNMECQIVAAAMAGATVHVQDVKDNRILHRLKIEPVLHSKLLSDEEYYKLVGGMTVNMCVSLSEVYSYLTAESFLLGVPVLTGTITPILHGHADLSLNCSTRNFEDPVEMAGCLESLLKTTGGWGWLRDRMLEVNANYREICTKVVEGWA